MPAHATGALLLTPTLLGLLLWPYPQQVLMLAYRPTLQTAWTASAGVTAPQCGSGVMPTPAQPCWLAEGGAGE